MPRTRNFADVIRAELAKDRDLVEAVRQECFNAHIARRVYDLRTEAGLTQKQLAQRINTQQSVISRIEDADYDGHSLALLQRIATALGKNLRIEFDNGAAAPKPRGGSNKDSKHGRRRFACS